tara:strand:- start:2264 stop:3013 length:750 start_codon:yes stop_codon:yes gene_type:complete
MIKYNFIKNYQDIQLWEKDLSKVNLKNKSSGKKTEFLISLKEFLKKEKILYIPSLSALSITILINLIGLPSYLNTLRLESKHQEFASNFEEYKNTQSLVKERITDLENYYQLYVLGSPTYTFSFFLQQTIPNDVQVSEFTLDKDGFQINVQAYEIETINNFIDSLLNWPIVKNETIKVRNIIKQQTQEGPRGPRSSSTKELFIVEISGKNNIVGISEKLPIFKESYNYGLINKIEKYIKLTDITNSTDS